MLFNSIEFLIFFPLVCLGYYVIPYRFRHLFLLVSSYYFYMCWNPKYALLLLAVTVITYFAGRQMGRATEISDGKKRIFRKKLIVALAFVSSLGFLFYFKYFEFAIGSFARLLGLAGIEVQTPVFDIVLPVGISFYTFQALSYVMEVYREQVPVEHNFFKYALFVSFFPNLSSGPIERARNLLAQINEKHKFQFEQVRAGLLLMLYGYFQKVVLSEYLGGGCQQCL